jgi:glycerol-3-phosphate acyltransferase PlsY
MPELSVDLLLRLAVAFALGSIPFAVVTMWGTGIDITRYGSGNPGFNNVLRYSKWRAALCLIGDAGKGMLPMVLFVTPGDSPILGWTYGMAAILGHCYSPFLKFNGGKGIATSAGVMLYLYPKLLVPCVAVYVVLRIVGSKMQWAERGTRASITASVLFVVLLFVFESRHLALLGLLLLVFVAWRHKKNFEVMAHAARQRQA